MCVASDFGATNVALTSVLGVVLGTKTANVAYEQRAAPCPQYLPARVNVAYRHQIDREQL